MEWDRRAGLLANANEVSVSMLHDAVGRAAGGVREGFRAIPALVKQRPQQIEVVADPLPPAITTARAGAAEIW